MLCLFIVIHDCLDLIYLIIFYDTNRRRHQSGEGDYSEW